MPELRALASRLPKFENPQSPETAALVASLSTIFRLQESEFDRSDSYAQRSFAIKTGRGRSFVKRIQLGGTNRMTIGGTGRAVIL